MARPKSEDKRIAILEAAVSLFAQRGVWTTPTSAISKAAGVAEGTLFTYFATKEVLVNELYRALKSELAEAMMTDFPQTPDLRTKFGHVWNRYVQWGVMHPAKFKVMAQLQLSDQITPASKAAGSAPFVEIERLVQDSHIHQQVHDYPMSFVLALFNTMAETTMTAIAQSRTTGIDADIDYCAIGFAIFWKGIARP